MKIACWVSAVFTLLACGAPAPVSSPAPATSSQAPSTSALGKRSPNAPDDCAQVPGKPPPEPTRIAYTGVAKAARCQREVYTIMGGVTHFLGVKCSYCHLASDYAADTHNKQVANWMARELVPRLEWRVARAGGSRQVWCQDCHAGKPKLLGNPRSRGFAIDWMTTHLVDDFQTLRKKPPKCKDCHGGDLGSPQFHSKVILSQLSGLPTAPSAASDPSAAPAASAAESAPSAAPAPSAAESAPSAARLPDFGGR